MDITITIEMDITITMENVFVSRFCGLGDKTVGEVEDDCGVKFPGKKRDEKFVTGTYFTVQGDEEAIRKFTKKYILNYG